jgi:hypothetical protein
VSVVNPARISGFAQSELKRTKTGSATEVMLDASETLVSKGFFKSSLLVLNTTPNLLGKR